MFAAELVAGFGEAGFTTLFFSPFCVSSSVVVSLLLSAMSHSPRTPPFFLQLR